MPVYDRGESVLGTLIMQGELSADNGISVNDATVIKKIQVDTIAVDPPDAATGDEKVSVALTITGVADGDVVLMMPPADLEDDLIPAGVNITDDDEATLYLYANAAVNGASKTWTYIWFDLT